MLQAGPPHALHFGQAVAVCRTHTVNVAQRGSVPAEKEAVPPTRDRLTSYGLGGVPQDAHPLMLPRSSANGGSPHDSAAVTMPLLTNKRRPRVSFAGPPSLSFGRVPEGATPSSADLLPP